MKVILLRDVKNIGRKYDVKEVNDGFARNGLIAKGSAAAATPENLGRYKGEIDRLKNQAVAKKEILNSGLKKISGLKIELTGNNNQKGHLFAAIHKEQIIQALAEKTGITLDPDWLVLSKPIKTIGEHELQVSVDGHQTRFFLLIS